MTSNDFEIVAHDGFSFTSEMELPFLVAFNAWMDGSHKVFVTRLGRGGHKVLFDDGDRTLSCPLLFGDDGKILYHSHAQVYAINAAGDEPRQA